MPFTYPSSNKWNKWIDEIWSGKNVAISARDCPWGQSQYWEEYQYHSLFSWYLHIWLYRLWRRYHNTSFQCVPCVTVSPHSHYHNIASRNTQQRKILQFFNNVGEQISDSDTWVSLVKNLVSEQYKRLDCHNWDNDLHQWGELANF